MEEGNKFIISLIENSEPFSICRFGSEHRLVLKFQKTGKILPFDSLSNNAGIYYKNKGDLILFCKLVDEAVKTTNCVAIFKELCVDIHAMFMKKYKIRSVPNRVLEPFFLPENIKPWTHYLKGKKVLIVSPFVESFKVQNSRNFKFFKDRHIFCEGQQFVFYKSYNTSGGNKIHNSWYETLTIMQKDISLLDFDIALLSCGGYGLPLIGFIKNKMNKSAIYIGGALQLFFGVTGKRWDNHPDIGKFIKYNGKFIRPSESEKIKNLETIDNGCYW